MSIDPASLVVGAVAGGVVGDVYTDAKERVKQAHHGDLPQHGPVELQMLVDIVSGIEHAIRKAQAVACPPEFRNVQLTQGPYAAGGSQPYRLIRGGYKHVSLLTATAFSIVCVTQVGPITFAMNAGWNALDLPDTTDMYIASGGPTNLAVVLYFGDSSLDITGV